ncbi:hypothetical protein, partial [Faecalibacterium sp.]|uniref:hypothetical protein n=1 Tax=Faecalibacterium sp. TaxID=1971605 RepID=UPI003A949CE5
SPVCESGKPLTTKVSGRPGSTKRACGATFTFYTVWMVLSTESTGEIQHFFDAKRTVFSPVSAFPGI